MLELLIQSILLIVGFYVIIKSADYFVDESAALGKHYGMSDLVIGLSIVAIGTSLPELFTSIGSYMFTDNYSDFIIGTIMGSNITNILLVFGVFLLFAGSFSIKKKEFLNVYFLFYSTIFLIGFTLVGFVNYFAILLVISYLIYITYVAKYQKNEILKEEEEMVGKVIDSYPKSFFILLLAIFGLVVGARLVVGSIESIGSILSIPTAYLSLTTIALASSLPELAVTVNTAKKKQYLIGIGNVLGSNIMNIAIVFGLSGFFGYYLVDSSLYYFSTIFLILATVLFGYSVLKRKFYKEIGYVFLALYALFIILFFIL